MEQKHGLVAKGSPAEQAADCTTTGTQAGHLHGSVICETVTDLWPGQALEPHGRQGCALQAAAHLDIGHRRLPWVRNRAAETEERGHQGLVTSSLSQQGSSHLRRWWLGHEQKCIGVPLIVQSTRAEPRHAAAPFARGGPPT